MNRVLDKKRKREKRKVHIRKHISGTAEKPRMSVYRSNKHLYVQVIDDIKGHTIVSANTMEADLRSLKNTVADGEKLGEIVGKRLLEKNVNTVVFDRNGYLFHGIVKSIADGARKAGIKF